MVEEKKIWAILALLFLLILYFINMSADQPEFDPKKDKHQSPGLDVFFFQAVCAVSPQDFVLFIRRSNK